ncbi:MAG: hypothetical protein ABI870_07615 [Rhodanobacter sp.]
MGTSTFAALAGMGMFAMLMIFVVGILIGALVLCVAFRLVVGYMPSYLRSLGAVVLTAVAVIIVSVVLRMIMPSGLSGLLSLVVQVLVGAAVVNYMLLGKDGMQIGFGKACLVQLVYIVIGFVIALILGFLLAGVIGGMIAASH